RWWPSRIAQQQAVQNGGAATGQADDDDGPFDRQVQNLRVRLPQGLEPQPRGQQADKLVEQLYPPQRMELDLIVQRTAQYRQRLVQRRIAEIGQTASAPNRLGLQRLGRDLQRRRPIGPVQRRLPRRRMLRPGQRPRIGRQFSIARKRNTLQHVISTTSGCRYGPSTST